MPTARRVGRRGGDAKGKEPWKRSRGSGQELWRGKPRDSRGRGTRGRRGAVTFAPAFRTKSTMAVEPLEAAAIRALIADLSE